MRKNSGYAMKRLATPSLDGKPFAWKAAELRKSESAWVLSWEKSEQRELRALATQSEKASSESVHSLPEKLTSKLAHVREVLEEGVGVALVRGLEIADWSEKQAKVMFLALARAIGTPVSQNAEGNLIFSVRNEGYAQQDPRTRGPNSNKGLSFHTDRCDQIGFLCLRQAKRGGVNELVSSAALYEEIRRTAPDVLRVLMGTFLYKRHVVDLGNERPCCEQPVFSFCQNRFAACFLRVLIDRADADPTLPDLTMEQKEALDHLEITAEKDKFVLRLRQKPGDLLFLNNWVTFHRRTAFEDHPEPEKRRHLLRVWLSPPNNRPLDEAFLENYGSVAAGVPRGGMKALGA